MRFVPGRIVGETIDTENKKGYILTLQAREQHIRREKASCNICSNQALNALAATIYLTAMGKKGIEQVSNLNLQKSNYLKDELVKAGIKIKFDSHSYNEFVIELNNLEKIKEELEENGIEPGLSLEKFHPDLKNCMLLTVTEVNTKEDIDELVKIITK